MDRKIFMERLEGLLIEVPDSERQEALQYYNDYFDDAGVENEQHILEELQSPERVAKIIKEGLGGKSEERGEYTESGYKNDSYDNNMEISKKVKNNQKNQNEKTTQKDSVGKIVLVLMLCIIGFPAIIAVASALFSFAVAVFTVVLVFAAVGIALMIGGIGMFIFGVIKLFTIPFGAMCLMGGGMILAGVGILFGLGVVALFNVVLPVVWRGLVAICKWPFNRRKGASV